MLNLNKKTEKPIFSNLQNKKMYLVVNLEIYYNQNMLQVILTIRPSI